jgi:hypothetical protein
MMINHSKRNVINISESSEELEASCASSCDGKSEGVVDPDELEFVLNQRVTAARFPTCKTSMWKDKKEEKTRSRS